MLPISMPSISALVPTTVFAGPSMLLTPVAAATAILLSMTIAGVILTAPFPTGSAAATLPLLTWTPSIRGVSAMLS